MAWFQELGAAGRLSDPGRPLQSTGKVVSGRDKVVKDGPYAEAKDVAGGYLIVEADDIG